MYLIFNSRISKSLQAEAAALTMAAGFVIPFVARPGKLKGSGKFNAFFDYLGFAHIK
jgi:hypothetical protein